MAIEAPLSKFKINGFKLYIAVCLIAGGVLAYDGYLSKYEWSKRHNFYIRHVVENDGKPDGTMNFNRKVPPILLVIAILLGIRWYVIKDKKLVAGENSFITPKREIAYDSIQKIDKTRFDSKGYFVITYKDYQGVDTDLKISDRTYDNLGAVLDLLVAKIS
ncbi:MAG: hypothetical protein DRP65_01205 [Planctomycetota bacterium]|nr:MAG: hypothetical protein DRP65_01205 [Planctomycetota bacterium]